MANSLAEIGGVIQGNWNDEEIIAGVADGVALAGWCVGFGATGGVDGDVKGTFKTGDFDEFVGILLPHHKGDMDTLIANGDICNIVIPQSGHLYGVYVADPTSSLAGEPLQIGEALGQLQVAGDIETEHVCRIYSSKTGDTFVIVIWGV